MSSYWRVGMAMPAFRTVRQLQRDSRGPLAPQRLLRERHHAVKIFRAWPGAADSELQRSFDEISTRRRDECAAENTADSSGGRRERNPDAANRGDRDRRPRRSVCEHRRSFNDVWRTHWGDFERDMYGTFGGGMFGRERERDGPARPDRAGRAPGDGRPGPAEVDPQAPSDRGFEVAVDLSGFAPEEISVAIVGDDLVRVEAVRRAELSGGGRVLRTTRELVLLPAGLDLDALGSSLDGRGTLRLAAPERAPSRERAVRVDVATAGDNSTEPVGEAAADDREDTGASHADEADSSTAEKPEEN